MFKKALLILLFCPILTWAVPPITTQGNQVLIDGQTGSLAGNSFFWSQWSSAYYNLATVAWLKKDWGTTIVRAAMGVEESGGYLADPSRNLQLVKNVVDAAIAEDIYVIIDWHSHDAESNTADAISFFRQMAQLYGDKNNVIFEVYNEPINSSWNSVKQYAESVIQVIRDEGSQNLIIVGSPTYSQDVDVASLNPITDFDNIAYTLHFYAGTHSNSLRNKALTALNNGIPLFVTEWGTINASGDGEVAESETQLWMSFLQDNNISHLNWAINDKAEGSSVLIGTEQGENNQGNWTDDLLTESGLLAKSIIQNWPQADISDVVEPVQPIETDTFYITPLKSGNAVIFPL